MIIAYVVVGVLVAHACFNGINSGLPDHVPEQNLGMVDVLYRFLKAVASAFLMYPAVTLSWHRPSILLCIFTYLLAYGLKKLVWHLSYKEYL